MKKNFILFIIILFLSTIAYILILNKSSVIKLINLRNQNRAIEQIPKNTRIVLDALINYAPSKNIYKNKDIQTLVDVVHTQLIYRLNHISYEDILNISSMTPELSQVFIYYRSKHNGFDRINQLKQIKGMDLLDIYDIITAVMMAYVTREMGQIMNSAEELKDKK